MSQQALPSLAVLISGRGSNLQAFIDACDSGHLPARIGLVISNNPAAAGLQRAERAGIATQCIDHRDYQSREAFDGALVDALRACDIELVILAGFMRILTPVLIEPYLGRLLNIHPSLLPKYRGLHTHRRAIEAGDTSHGCTVHLVTPELDDGPVLGQATVPILPDDTPDTLAARVLEQEHRLYPAVLRRFASGNTARLDL